MFILCLRARKKIYKSAKREINHSQSEYYFLSAHDFFLHHVPSVSVTEMQSSSIWNRVRPASPCHEHDLRKYFQVNCFRMVYLLNWKGKSVVTRFEWKIAIRLRNAIAIFSEKKTECWNWVAVPESLILKPIYRSNVKNGKRMKWRIAKR